MINIYSIQEIIAASEAILTTQVVKKKLIIDENPTHNNYESNQVKELPISHRKTKLTDQSIPKEINSIILDAENSQIQKKINNSLKELPTDENEHASKDLKVTKKELIESMYLTFLKKIKKNTLKVIIDLREEIVFLTKNISSLKENKKKQNYNIRLLKKNVIDLTNIGNELNNNLKVIQNNFDILKEDKENLGLNHTLLEEKNNNLNLDHVSLKNNFSDQQKLLDQTKDQNNILKKENNEIKLQLDNYKNNEHELKLKIKKLEEEILINNKLLNETNSSNNKIKLQISDIDDYKHKIKQLTEKNENLEKTIDDLRITMSNNNQVINISDLENKIKHYQDENIRISSELVESDKRFTATKESLNMLQNQRSDLVEKLNSINHVIKGENIISNVFDDSADKTHINQKPKKNIDLHNLNKQIKDIFS